MSTDKKREQPPLKIGELLIKEGYIQESDIEKALLIQSKESETSDQPIGKILLKKGLISKEQLRSLLEHPCQRKQLGELALNEGLINKEQLTECLDKLKDEEKIGEALVQAGYLTEKEVKDLLYKQIGSQRIGDLALKFGMIDEDGLKLALSEKRSKRTIGGILCDLGMITPNDLNHVLQKYRKQLKLGDILVRQNYITQEQLDAALTEQTTTGSPLGEILVNRRFITADDLCATLSRQYNIPYEKLDELNYHENEIAPLISVVGQRYAESNLILPLRQKGNQLVLAVFEPDRSKGLQELKTVYTYLEMRCVLISRDKFNELFEILYGESLSESIASNQATSRPETIDGFQISLSEELDEKEDKVSYAMSSMEVEQIVNYIIKYGIMNDASDIHIEQDRSGAKYAFALTGY